MQLTLSYAGWGHPAYRLFGPQAEVFLIPGCGERDTAHSAGHIGRARDISPGAGGKIGARLELLRGQERCRALLPGEDHIVRAADRLQHRGKRGSNLNLLDFLRREYAAKDVNFINKAAEECS